MNLTYKNKNNNDINPFMDWKDDDFTDEVHRDRKKDKQWFADIEAEPQEKFLSGSMIEKSKILSRIGC